MNNQTIKNQIVKNLIVVIAFVAFLSLPMVAKADTFTFKAPNTSPGGSNGPNGVDLDHHNAYTWKLTSGLTVPAGQTITGATITFYNISNWDTNANKLFVHLLNSSTTYATASATSSALVGWHNATVNAGAGFNGSMTSFRDVLDSAPVTDIFDNFAGSLYSSNPLVSGPDGANNVLLTTLVNLPMSPAATITYTFTAAQLTSLATFISNGDLAFGFDSDCHYWNNGITFSYTTAPTATPEPATMVLLGTGLAGFGWFQRRRRSARKVNASEPTV